jgi:hypothetical protein
MKYIFAVITLIFFISCSSPQQQKNENLSDVSISDNNASFQYYVGEFEAQNVATYAIATKIWDILKAHPKVIKIGFRINEKCTDSYGNTSGKSTEIVLDEQWLTKKEVTRYADAETFGNKMSQMNIFGGEWRGCNM